MVSQAGTFFPIFLGHIQDKLISEISKRPTVSREESYYRQEIKKISTVDEFLKDHRLVSYALKAHNLSDILREKTLIRKILESDPNDSKSLININSKFKKFAQSFDFSLSHTPKSIQSGIQQERLISRYKNYFLINENDVFAKSEYFRNNAKKITSIDQLINNKRLLDYVLKSFDIDHKHISLPFLKEVMTYGLDHPDKFFTKSKDSRFRQIAEYFHIKSNNPLNKETSILTKNQIENIVNKYLDRTTYFVPEKNIPYERSYYESTIGSISSIKQLVQDPILFKIVKLALSIDSRISSNHFLKLLMDKNKSIIQIKDFFHTDFINKNFTNKIQTNEQIKQLLDLYEKNCNKSRNETIRLSIANYQKSLTSISSVDEFLQQKSNFSSKTNYNKPITPLEVALRAYDININDTYKCTLRDILTSDPSDPNSYVNKSHNTNFINFNHAFNFDKKGKPKHIPMVHSPSTKIDYIKSYTYNKMNHYINNKKTFLTKTEQSRLEKKIDEDVDYYVSNIDEIDSFEKLIADKRLMNIVLESKGIDDSSKISQEFLKRIFQSDLKDRKSFANKYNDNRYKEIMYSFDFDSINNSFDKNNGKVQNNIRINNTVSAYKHQILESEIAKTNPDMEMALYFQRTVPHIGNMYEILADRNIFQVISKTLKLPIHFSALDQKKQVSTLQKYINLKDFKDPKKVQQFLYKFNSSIMTNYEQNTSLFTSTNRQDNLQNYDFHEIMPLSLNNKEKLSIANVFSNNSHNSNFVNAALRLKNRGFS
ncbi:MAG: hypothetical protein C4617_04250 [Candidatus Liberibacter europaeus]|uniref:DUF1217 domain-containing protein n=1 Tax=Candidatus Liberibacter europaeus TaxID=744859 RepID=A0A2T4VXC1_9HYPH|nr:hypothetical protein [Candidatus Liberibacter europaeus]PTL86415.1 MAG: hypothetical protein C4617_04250 [Candidatus Liberibacter europaeus]